eukprot:2887197-Prorocentrum_lima.AAC.1
MLWRGEALKVACHRLSKKFDTSSKTYWGQTWWLSSVPTSSETGYDTAPFHVSQRIRVAPPNVQIQIRIQIRIGMFGGMLVVLIGIQAAGQPGRHPGSQP